MRGPDRDRMQPHQPSYWALKTSAAHGCELCEFFWQSFAYDRTKHYETEKRDAMASVSERYPGREISLVAWEGNFCELDRIHVLTTGDVPSPTSSEDERDVVDPTMHPDHAFGLSGVVDLYADATDAAAWHGGVTGRPLPGAAGSEGDYASIKSWVEHCHLTHSACSKATDGQLPKRVIDVGSGLNPPMPRLIEDTGALVAQYVTLSHCWGGHVVLTTTTATIEDRKRGIAMATMPKTFADAVQITRGLGLRYLWIDSLCIMQDSKADWEEQSAVMCDVYANGYLNIAARAAPNASVGCLIPRPDCPPSCPLKYISTDGAVLGTMHVRSPTFRPERLVDTPLDKRGWILQELVLSPRVVYFGAHQLYWECATAVKRQDGKHHNVMTDNMLSEDFKNELDPNVALESKLPPRQESWSYNLRFWQWYMMVQCYTRRSLTYQSDMLPAISGIAKAFSAKLRCGYISGIWKNDLLNGLAWWKRRPGQAIEGSSLPTWLWARVTGETHFAARTRNLLLCRVSALCVVLDVAYDSHGVNPFGEVANAQLRLWACVFVAYYDTSRIALPAQIGTRPTQQGRDSIHGVNTWAVGGKVVGRLHPDCANTPCEGSPIYCLPLCFGNKGGHPSTDKLAQYTFGYLALQAVDLGHDSFRRVGYITREAYVGTISDGDLPHQNLKPKVVVLV